MSEGPRVRDRSPSLLRSVLSDRRAWIAVPVLGLLVLAAAFPQAFDGPGPRPCVLTDSLLPPSPDHLFGRDLQGCDLFARTVHGARNSLLVGLGSVALAALLAAFAGTAAGLSRTADAIVRTLVDLFLGIPVVLLGLALLTARQTRTTLDVAAVLAVFAWPLLTRIMRTEVLRVAGREYVEAARALGASRWRLLTRHVAPNAAGSMLSVAVLTVAILVNMEAILTYVGAGLELPETSWGILMYEASFSVRRAPHLLLPGIALVVATGALVLLAEVVRDARPPS